jgi:predicted nuclease of restriction endonuclease-like (RecB) superfamily
MNIVPANYREIIADLKERIRKARLKASVLVNNELLNVYWEIGKTILIQQEKELWGAKVIDKLSADLRTEFPDFKGLSVRNLKYMRAFAEAWPKFGQAGLAQNNDVENQSDIIVQAELAQLTWYHHITLLDKVKNRDHRIFYIRKAIENGWSRDVMVHQIETGAFERTGNAITNFKGTLPKLQSDLAQQAIRNPYVFDFLSFTEEMREVELEKGLVQHMKKFMLELGKGFSWVGNQRNLVVQGDDFFLDLLFFNFHMNCFVIFELKVGEFKPEFTGKLNFYVNTIDQQLKMSHHNPTIGILLCKTPNETVIKYSLQGIESPIGVSSYQFEKALPESLKAELPTIEELEKEIEQGYEELKNPSEKKLDMLKEMLKNLKEPEMMEKRNKENCKQVFKVVKSLLIMMQGQYDAKIRSYFTETELTIYLTGHGFNNWNDAETNFYANPKEHVEFKLEFRSSGFKPAGTKAFNCWTGLHIHLFEYKYAFNLHNNQNTPLLEKLYHEVVTEREKNELVETWMGVLLDSITFQVKRINSIE